MYYEPFGEIGVTCSQDEMKYLLAVAKAQKETGAALVFHRRSLGQLDVLESAA